MYDEELRVVGMRVTQYTLLQALKHAGALTQGELGNVLGLDSTTLTRSLRPLIESRWVRSEPGADRRERKLQLSTAGLRVYNEALPQWRRAQARLKEAFGAKRLDHLERDLVEIASASL